MVGGIPNIEIRGYSASGRGFTEGAGGGWGSSDGLRSEAEVGGVETALPNGCDQIAGLHATVRGYIASTPFVYVRLAHFTLQTLTHQPKQ